MGREWALIVGRDRIASQHAMSIARRDGIIDGSMWPLSPLIVVVALEIIPIPGFSEPLSSLSHLAGAGIFAVLTVPLLRKGRHVGHRVALGLFAFAVLLMFSMSGTFHLLAHGGAGRAVLQRLDHASIFILIAASFTPPHAILFRGWLRWGIIALVWVIAATVIPLKMVFFTSISEPLDLGLYLGFGWVGVISGIAVWHRYGLRFMSPLILGGVAYSVGAVLDFARAPNLIPGVLHAHDLFHLFVIAGVSFHWQFAHRVADGALPRPSMDAGEAADEIRHAIDEWVHPEQDGHGGPA